MLLSTIYIELPVPSEPIVVLCARWIRSAAAVDRTKIVAGHCSKKEAKQRRDTSNVKLHLLMLDMNRY